VTIPKKNTEKSDKRAIKLTELGPRLNLKLIKIQDGFCAGEVIYHSLIQKTASEVQELKKRKQTEAELKKKRREEQEANVQRKKEAIEESDEDIDDDIEMDDDFNFENPDESDDE
jgi:ribosome biogenesis protein SSF1/2